MASLRQDTPPTNVVNVVRLEPERQSTMKWSQKKTLSYRQKRAATLLVAGFKTTHVATMVGVRRETIWAWKKQPRFAKRVEKLQADFLREVRRLVLPLMERAFKALDKMLNSTNDRDIRFAIVKVFQLNGKLPWPERRRRA